MADCIISARMSSSFPHADVVGIGENATDTILRLPRFPAFNASMRILSADQLAGGQVATAMVACQRWDLRARYFGKLGDDAAAKFQREEMAKTSVEVHWSAVENCDSQVAYILVDDSTGERTILFERDERLSHTIQELPRDGVISTRALHLDGHNARIHAIAAQWARQAGVPVIADVDNLYPGHEELLSAVDYLVGSHDLAQRLTALPDHCEALPAVAKRFGNRLVAATLGSDGVLAYEAASGNFSYCPAFDISPRDTTGAGDLFHAGFVFGVVQGWPLARTLDFSCAAAALNCLATGARSGICSFEETETFRLTAPRRAPSNAFAKYNVLGR